MGLVQSKFINRFLFIALYAHVTTVISTKVSFHLCVFFQLLYRLHGKVDFSKAVLSLNIKIDTKSGRKCRNLIKLKGSRIELHIQDVPLDVLFFKEKVWTLMNELKSTFFVN